MENNSESITLGEKLLQACIIIENCPPQAIPHPESGDREEGCCVTAKVSSKGNGVAASPHTPEVKSTESSRKRGRVKKPTKTAQVNGPAVEHAPARMESKNENKMISNKNHTPNTKSRSQPSPHLDVTPIPTQDVTKKPVADHQASNKSKKVKKNLYQTKPVPSDVPPINDVTPPAEPAPSVNNYHNKLTANSRAPTTVTVSTTSNTPTALMKKPDKSAEPPTTTTLHHSPIKSVEKPANQSKPNSSNHNNQKPMSKKKSAPKSSNGKGAQHENPTHPVKSMEEAKTSKEVDQKIFKAKKNPKLKMVEADQKASKLVVETDNKVSKIEKVETAVQLLKSDHTITKPQKKKAKELDCQLEKTKNNKAVSQQAQTSNMACEPQGKPSSPKSCWGKSGDAEAQNSTGEINNRETIIKTPIELAVNGVFKSDEAKTLDVGDQKMEVNNRETIIKTPIELAVNGVFKETTSTSQPSSPQIILPQPQQSSISPRLPTLKIAPKTTTKDRTSTRTSPLTPKRIINKEEVDRIYNKRTAQIAEIKAFQQEKQLKKEEEPQLDQQSRRHQQLPTIGGLKIRQWWADDDASISWAMLAAMPDRVEKVQDKKTWTKTKAKLSKFFGSLFAKQSATMKAFRQEQKQWKQQEKKEKAEREKAQEEKVEQEQQEAEAEYLRGWRVTPTKLEKSKVEATTDERKVTLSIRRRWRRSKIIPVC